MSLRPVLAIVFAATVLAACAPSENVEVGGAAPELTAMDMDGNAVTLSQMKGKIVFVNFWSSGCGPCLVEMPEIDEVYKRHRGDGFEVLAINMGQDDDTIKNVNRRLGVTYPLLSDRLKITSRQYGVAFVPTSFLIDREGVVLERINGPLTRDQLMRKVADIL